MLKTFYAILMLAGLSEPAWSQTRGESGGRGSARHFGHLLPSDGGRAAATAASGEDRVQCLVRRSTGRTECRSMHNWRRLAQRLDEPRKREFN